MRFLYLLLWFAYKLAFRLYFRRIVVSKNSPHFFGRTIFVSNHPGSFMDPLLIAAVRKPIVFFMTRSDVFNAFTKPILWAVHMLPIYRQRDGVDTKSKNAGIFEKTNRVLSKNRNVLIFGEGFTDDTTPRHLFPIKKGALRIGFSALEYMDWKKEVYVQGLGVNYMDPQIRGTDVVVQAGQPIRLNDFQALYEENPNKALTEITRRLEKDMRTLITDIHDLEWSNFHEQAMILTRKGMNGKSFDPQLSVETRLNYSKKLADFLNQASESEKKELLSVKNQSDLYFKHLDELGISEEDLYRTHVEKQKLGSSLTKFIILFPFFILGLLHTALPYWWVKRFVEKSLKRPVFWPGTKLTLAFFVVPLFNLPVLFWFMPKVLACFSLPFWVFVLYFTLIAPISALFLSFLDGIKNLMMVRKVKKMRLQALVDARTDVLQHLNRIIPQ